MSKDATTIKEKQRIEVVQQVMDGRRIQVDASWHDWLEGRGPWLTQVGGIDEATSTTWCSFEEAETTSSYLHLLERVTGKQGVPPVGPLPKLKKTLWN